MRTLIVDNYDSFTYNLVHRVAVVNQESPVVVRNDELNLDALAAIDFDNVIISPGPGHPERESDFGICRSLLLECAKPTLGVCLGHQGIATVHGGAVARALLPVHGKSVPVHHTGIGILRDVPSPFQAARYHSLIVERPLPTSLLEIAWSNDDLIMALMHRTLPLWGVQFHPESIMTEHGDQILRNFRDLSRSLTPRTVHQVTAISQRDQPEPIRVKLIWKEIPNPPLPELAYTQLFAEKPSSFWLDSSLAEPCQARWDYFGAAALEGTSLEIYETQERLTTHLRGSARQQEAINILDYLAPNLRSEVENAPPCPFVGGWVGWFGYEFGREFGHAIRGTSFMPDVVLQAVDRFIAFDHQSGRMYAVCVTHSGDDASSHGWLEEIEAALQLVDDRSARIPAKQTDQIVCFRLDRNRNTYISDIEKCLEWIYSGESYQICLTNKIRTHLEIDSLDLYRILRRINPAPFAAYFAWPGGAVLSASPERFLQADNKGNVETKPIKGTIKRHSDPTTDRLLALDLAGSDKNRSENVMIVDLMRNDLSRVCQPDSVVVPKLCEIESYATVHQLVSTIQGKLEADKTVIDLIRASFPGGSMTGAPKTRTLELIDELEGAPRGVYSGTLGWIGYDGAADLSIVIRAIVQTGQNISFGVGSGIVAQSIPEDEFDEMLLKAEASIRAIVTAVTGSFDEQKYVIEGADHGPRTS